jgi:hypothetical protein
MATSPVYPVYASSLPCVGWATTATVSTGRGGEGVAVLEGGTAAVVEVVTG